MTTTWLIRALAAGVLLAAAAVFGERVAGWFGAPRRWTWAAAMAATLLLPLFALVAPGLLPALDAPEPPPTSVVVPGAGYVPAAPEEPAATVAAGVPFGRMFAIGWMAATAAILALLAVSSRRMEAALGGMPGARLHGVRGACRSARGPPPWAS